jgi:hypothetical protein
MAAYVSLIISGRACLPVWKSIASIRDKKQMTFLRGSRTIAYGYSILRTVSHDLLPERSRNPTHNQRAKSTVLERTIQINGTTNVGRDYLRNRDD